MNNDEKLVCIGQINRPHGLKGLVKASLGLPNFFDETTLLGKTILLQESNQNFTFTQISQMNNVFLVELDEINDIEEAEKLRGQKIYMKRVDIGELPAGEFFIDDLIGLKALDLETKKEIGGVLEVVEMPQNSLLKIKLIENASSFLLPMLDEFVEIDLGEQAVFLKEWQPFAELAG